MTTGEPLEPLAAAHDRDRIDRTVWAHTWFDHVADLEPGSARYLETMSYVAHSLDLNPATRTQDQDDAGQIMALLQFVGKVSPFRGHTDAITGETDLTSDQERARDDWEVSNYHAMLLARLIVSKTLGSAEAEARERRLAYQATHDPLTGLLNRQGMQQKVGEILKGIEHGEYTGMAILYLDLDKFGHVNTQGGHKKGDMMLEGVAAVIDRGTRKPSHQGPGDVVVRINPPQPGQEHVEAETVRPGGDEFVVLMPLVNNRPVWDKEPAESEDEEAEQRLQPTNPLEAVQKVGNRLKHRITTYLVGATEGKIPGIGVSIGYGLWEPGMNVDDVIVAADAHMYQVKHASKAATPSSVEPTPKTI